MGIVTQRRSFAAIDLYKQALCCIGSVYGGMVHRLANTFSKPIPPFLFAGVFRLLELLNSSNSYREIIEICELASLIEPYDETLHLYFMQVNGLGDIKGALATIIILHLSYTKSWG